MTADMQDLFSEEAESEELDPVPSGPTTYEHLPLDQMPPGMVRPSFKALAEPSRLWGTGITDPDVLLSSPRRMAPDMLRLFLANKTPITLWGPVGSRKTRTIESMASERDENGTPYQVITIQPSTEDPTVIHGMMYTTKSEDGRTIMSRSIPDVAKQILDYWVKYRGLTILFLDEMTTCMPAQQHALLGLLTHGKYGDIITEPYTTIAMAANPEGTVSTVNALGEQVMNRGGHIAWYGDVSLFLEDWGSGFNNPSRAPARKTKWYITELLNSGATEAFRNPDNWDTKTLVPQELIEHTERSTTELARMLDMVEATFKNCPDIIRFHYIIEVTRALMGDKWADRISKITGMEADMVSGAFILEKTRGVVTPSMTADELKTAFPDGLSQAPGGGKFRQDQVNIVMEDLMKDVNISGESNRNFNLDSYLAAWAFVVSMATSGEVMSLHAHMISLMKNASLAVKLGLVPKEAAIPAFVSTDLRNTLKGIAASQRA